MPTIEELRARESRRVQRVYWFARGRRRHLAKFSPLDISGLQVWLDASDNSSLFQDAAKTTQATTDDDPVGAWADKSGNGYDVTQATADRRPLYKTGVQNSKPILRFDGSNDTLKNDSNPVIAQPNTVFIVAKFDDPDTNSRFVLDGYAAGGRHSVFASSNTWRAFAGGTLDSGVADDTSYHIFTILFDTTSSIIRLDGAQIASGSTGGVTLDGISVGALTAGTSNAWDGDVAEILIYDSDQTTNFSRLENYLAGKWAITLS